MELKSDSLRQEVKYKVFFLDLPKFYHWLTSTSDFKQTFCARQINSLYLDTANYDLAFANITGQSKRFKVRGRWYSLLGTSYKSNNIESNELSIKCEIKRKVNSYSDKINVGSCNFINVNNSISDLYTYIETYCIKASEKYGLKNAKYLKKSALISYNREYYESSSINGFRLTVDKNIKYSSPITNGSNILLSKNYFIVEMKFAPNIRPLVVQYLKKFPFRPVRSSKYVAAMAQLKKVSY